MNKTLKMTMTTPRNWLHAPLWVFAFLWAGSVSAAILPIGAGSVADTVDPASHGCVVDNGNWITNAGVVKPAIAGCNPTGDYNGVPSGTPTKLFPQLAGKATTEPTATHRWWGSVPFYGEGQVGGSGAGYLTADPLMARVTNRGVRVLGLPNGLRVQNANQFVYQVPDPASEVFDGIAIGNSMYSTLNAYMKDHSDGSITVEWRSGTTPVMEATLVHGSPYMFFEVFAGTPVIRTKAPVGGEKGIFHQGVNSLGVWTSVAGNRNSYLIIGDGATQFTTPEATQTGFNPASRRFTLVWLPVTGAALPSSTMIADFSAHALNRVARVNVNYAVNPSTQAVTVTQDYLNDAGARVTTLAGLMPLQWKHTTEPLGTYKTRSARGVIRFTPASSFVYQMPFVGVLPLLPNQLTPADETRLRALVTEFMAAGAASWNPRRDTYWSGKAYGKVAEVAAIARSIGMVNEANALINWLKSELADWFNASTSGTPDKTKYFSYDKNWSTLLGFEESFGAQQQLNDHHFHYGYFVRAAAEICRVDASWCGGQAYGPMVELLIRDYAAGRNDPMFPYLRNFDPANGFSWASGHADFALGNNNESTSEAANAYGAIVLYGLITGNQDLVNRGVYLHASTAAAYWEYWNNLDAFRGLSGDFNNFPAGYNKMATSIIWGAGAVFSTWFSGAYAHILGIQGLPLNPLVLHIGQHADYLSSYVTLGLSQSSNGQPSGLPAGQWPDIWWNILAMTDPQRAIDDFNSLNLNYAVEEGESKAHTFQWIHAFKALGTVETGKGSITADYASAAVFKKNGLLTYVAYNLGGGARHVRFSDGMAINVPAQSVGIKRTGDAPDQNPGGDTQAPTPPGTPTASSVTATSAALSWPPASDNTAVAGYRVSVAGQNLSTATATVTVNGLTPATRYPVSVVAFDTAGNSSSASSGSFVTASASDTQSPTTPGVPVASGVTASGAVLSWTAATDNVGVTGYEVSVAGSTVSTAAATITVSGLSAATVYPVTVRAFDAVGNRSAASTTSFTTLSPGCTTGCGGPLPVGWSGQDIGSPTPGSASFANGVYTTRANGADIWGSQDNFHFAHQTLSGDGRLTARVTALELTDAWAKAGVMLRATLANNSPNAFMAVTGSSGSAFQRRTTAGGSSLHSAGPNVRAPYWVRLVRQGNLFTGSVSADGINWTEVGSQTITMPATVYAGLAHTSHRAGVLGTASYSNVEWAAAGGPDTQSPTKPGTPVASNVTATGATLSWLAATDNVGVTGYDVTAAGKTVSTAATSLVLGGLSAATPYPVSVQAVDAAGNRSAASTGSFTTPASGCAPSCVNLALGRAATQSSTGYGGTAGKAADGNSDGKLANGSVTHTNLDAQAWWQVDLGQVGSIESVQVYNRTDCCGTRLSNFHVFVSASDMSGKTPAQLTADPAVARVLVATLAGEASITLPLVATGRFVKVQLNGSAYLSLAEVRVLGR